MRAVKLKHENTRAHSNEYKLLIIVILPPPLPMRVISHSSQNGIFAELEITCKSMHPTINLWNGWFRGAAFNSIISSFGWSILIDSLIMKDDL